MKLRFEIELEQLEVMAIIEKAVDKVSDPQVLKELIGLFIKPKEE